MKRILTTLLIGVIASYGATFNVSDTPELRTALSTAATNGEDDTIILADGNYSSEDDGQGTFIYQSNESNGLTLEGSNQDNVAISGSMDINSTSSEQVSFTLEDVNTNDLNLNESGNISAMSVMTETLAPIAPIENSIPINIPENLTNLPLDSSIPQPNTFFTQSEALSDYRIKKDQSFNFSFDFKITSEQPNLLLYLNNRGSSFITLSGHNSTTVEKLITPGDMKYPGFHFSYDKLSIVDSGGNFFQRPTGSVDYNTTYSVTMNYNGQNEEVDLEVTNLETSEVVYSTQNRYWNQNSFNCISTIGTGNHGVEITNIHFELVEPDTVDILNLANKYILEHPKEFDPSSNVHITGNYIESLASGWTLTGTQLTITNLSIFDSAKIIWVYNNASASWSAYSSDATMKQKIIDIAGVDLITTIPAGSGIWVQK